MPRICCNLKGGAFFAAAFNLLVGGLTLGDAIYKIVINKNARVGLLIIMFLMSALLIHNGVLLIIGIVMVNKEYLLLYLVLNFANWLVGSFAIFKELSSTMAILTYVGLSMLLVMAWCLEIVIYMYYKHLGESNMRDTEIEDKSVSNS